MLEKATFALRGNILHTPTPRAIVCMPESYLVCEKGKAAGVFAELPERFRGIPVEDCGDGLVIPGLVDLHLHAPQYSFRALGMDLELVHRVSTFAGSILDTLPYSGSILMLLPVCHMKLKEIYPAMFVTTVLSTLVGTVVIALIMTLFPMLP